MSLGHSGATYDEAVAYAERWGLVSHERATKMLEFLTDPTWRAYISCYLEGLPLCRSFTGGDPIRFGRLLDELKIPQPRNGTALVPEEAARVAGEIGLEKHFALAAVANDANVPGLPARR